MNEDIRKQMDDIMSDLLEKIESEELDEKQKEELQTRFLELYKLRQKDFELEETKEKRLLDSSRSDEENRLKEKELKLEKSRLRKDKILGGAKIGLQTIAIGSYLLTFLTGMIYEQEGVLRSPTVKKVYQSLLSPVKDLL